MLNDLLSQLQDVQSDSDLRIGAPAPVPAVTPAPAVKKNVELPFAIELLNEGTGQKTVPEGSRVTVHYEGWLVNPDGTDGQVFDSSLKRGQPFTFNLGEGQVIAGWDYGIPALKKGQTAVLTIPPDLAYGAQGYGQTIPPNSTLKFKITVVDFN